MSDQLPYSEETYLILKDQDWAKITMDLINYTYHLLNVSNLKGGIEIEDIVQDAIIKVYSGERLWNRLKDPDLIKFLKYSVIKSLVSNYHESKIAKTQIAVSRIDLNMNDSDESDPFFETVEGNVPLPDEELFAIEILSTIRKKLEDDIDAALIFEELIKGGTPQSISNDLGITITDVNNALKRIRNTKAKEFNQKKS